MQYESLKALIKHGREKREGREGEREGERGEEEGEGGRGEKDGRRERWRERVYFIKISTGAWDGTVIYAVTELLAKGK